MRWYTRIIFGLNTVYQLAIGLIGLFIPAKMLELYKASAADQQVTLLQASMRGLGFNILFGAVISAIIAKNPDRHPILLPLMAVLSVLTIVGWVLNVVSGQMTMDQVGIDIVVQVLILIAVFGYYGKAKRVVR